MFDKTNIANKLRDWTNPYQEMGRQYLYSLRDVRNIGLLVFTVIVLLISWSGVKTIQTNYGLQKQISKLQQQNRVASLENSNLTLQNQYLNTNQYLEVTARANLGLAAPGETELLVPDSVALAHSLPVPSNGPVKSSVPHQPAWQRNLQSWVDFLLHRSDASQ